MSGTLKQHKLKKGKFVTPLNSIPNLAEMSNDDSWAYGRLAEYIWIGLVLDYYGRDAGLRKMVEIINGLHAIAPEIVVPKISVILKLEESIQRKVYNLICTIVDKKTLTPLTVFLTHSYAPVFSEVFYSEEIGIEERIKGLTQTMSSFMWHQSNDATDIRFIILYSWILSGKMHLPIDLIKMIWRYPELPHDDEEMRMIRPMIRSSEMNSIHIAPADHNYISSFWRCVSEMTDCNLLSVQYPEESRDCSTFIEILHEIFLYLSSLYSSTQPLDDKMIVLLGIATYSYKQFKEVYDLKLSNSITGRSSIRLLIEDFIMMKYLLKNETEHPNIWQYYKMYGIGQYKLVLLRWSASGENRDKAHFDMKYIDLLVNEDVIEDAIDMDTNYFNKQSMREKAESVDEKDLYGLLYDYDSSFEHGLWGAIRETSLLKCDNPAHQYHCVPDVHNDIRLKSVLPDCIMMMKKTIQLLNEVYGIPDELLNEVMSYEI